LISKFISEHVQEPISLDTLADQVHLSKYHLVRVFKATTGVTIHTFVTQKRLIMACDLIWGGTPLNELCFLCGFQNYSSFFRNFKTVYGISPLEYKNYFEDKHLLD
jgi:AraC-like DNA-binding protein